MKSINGYPRYPPRVVVRITERLRALFLRANRRFTHPNVVMWESVHQFWLAAGVGVAAELGIAELLKQKARSIPELAQATATHEASLYRIMRMLSSQGIFRENRKGQFSNTRLSRPLQEDQIRYLLMLHLSPVHFRLFADLMGSVRSGKSATDMPSGADLFGHIASDEQRLEWFNRAMSNATAMQIPALLPSFPFRRFRHIIDLGGGQGLLLAEVLKQHTAAKGLLFDLPGAIKKANIQHDPDLEGRMQVQEGDFFKAVPLGGDLYMLKSVLHDWEDGDALRILQRVHEAMDENARLIIIESVLGERNRPSYGIMTDILMMVCAGGKERSLAQFVQLLESSGFRFLKAHRNITPHCLIEAEKA